MKFANKACHFNSTIKTFMCPTPPTIRSGKPQPAHPYTMMLKLRWAQEPSARAFREGSETKTKSLSKETESTTPSLDRTSTHQSSLSRTRFRKTKAHIMDIRQHTNKRARCTKHNICAIRLAMTSNSYQNGPILSFEKPAPPNANIRMALGHVPPICLICSCPRNGR